MSLFNDLLTRYLAGTLSPQERETLHRLLREERFDEEVKELIDQHFRAWQDERHGDPQIGDLVFARLEDKVKKKGGRHFRMISIGAAAACVLAVTGIYLWKTNTQHSIQTARQARVVKQDIAPGGNRATLTLTNGAMINLDSAANGWTTRQGGDVVAKQGEGKLAYSAQKTYPAQKNVTDIAPPGLNELRTPRGGQYEVVLPDGTRVWLNAASSLRYPTVFKGRDRVVTLEGEAYFEVATDPAHPFHISVPGMDVRVLGTAFNIMAYANEDKIRTTLLGGRVQVAAPGSSAVTLQPGEQAILDKPGASLVVATVDTAEVIAWKEGLFLFNKKADLTLVMRQLERWYDVDVRYEGPVSGKTFYGGIQKGLPLSEVLSILEEAGVRFRLEGRVITVLP